MNNAKVTGLRGVELAVKDLNQSIAFYQCVWGLDPVVTEGDTVHLRANGGEHHVVTLRERPKHGLLGIHFATQDRIAVDALHAKAKAYGVKNLSTPAELPSVSSTRTDGLIGPSGRAGPGRRSAFPSATRCAPFKTTSPPSNSSARASDALHLAVI